MSAAGSNPAPSALDHGAPRRARPAHRFRRGAAGIVPRLAGLVQLARGEFLRRPRPRTEGRVGMQDDRAGVDLDDPARLLAARRLESGGVGNAVLDRLCALAARLLSAGSAQVSLLTDVQLVVGGVGLGARAMQDGATLREEALCTVTA